MNSRAVKDVKFLLEKVPGVQSVTEIVIRSKLIDYVCVEKSAIGMLTVQRLDVGDAAALFDFYFQGLSEEGRSFWPPYPLFSPMPETIGELSQRILDWQKEDDWTVLEVIKERQIVGVGLLKRYKTDRPTSGLAIRNQVQNLGLGFLLQTMINAQACLLGLKNVFATIAQGNTASQQLHKKCAFQETGKLVPHFGYIDGIKQIDRYDIEVVLDVDGVGITIGDR